LTVVSQTPGAELFSDFNDAPVVQNNFLLSSWTSLTGSAPSIDNDFNAFAPTGSQLSEGSHSIILSRTAGFVVNALIADLDIGAYQHSSGAEPSVPQNLRIVP
jgi:hypothetical protein